MAFPKRHTRRIAVNGVQYVWHLNHGDIDFGQTQVTIGHAKSHRWLLHADPYQIEPLPANVRAVILWALDQGWMPQVSHEPMLVSREDGAFFWCPYSQRSEHPRATRAGWIQSIFGDSPSDTIPIQP